MLNTLVISNNIDFIQELIFCIDEQNLDMKISRISYNTDKTFNLLKNKDFDVIFFDNNLLEYYDKIFFKKYQDLIIISSTCELSTKIADKKFQKASKININNDLSGKRSKIIKELEYLGYNFKYTGTHYLVDAILYVCTSSDETLNNLQGSIYPIIAKKYNRTKHNVKNNLINATLHMYYDSSIEKLQKYFNLYDDAQPSVKQVIFTVSNKIR